ncbi:MAG: TRAP transporter small permease subunit [Methylibium sp.]|uniref:TRAP transporter small permease subunit n=1 Tax=Methylibium sp. TaxID=2067992 RepID=UPI00181606C1|nr:TRAP transporter small permease subunit [Methylibium sp.]MBA3598368.1 TRAP transporter small permease subunit [Methylibium sp.]
MQALLRLSRGIDALNELVGKLVLWLVLAAVLISAGNAVIRKAFNVSSNAYLEIQWYLFAGVFMLGAGYTLLRNAHVRIDFVSQRLSRRSNAIIDILGLVLVLMPLAVLMIDLSWPLFMRAWISGEVSGNAGGLIRWPVLLLIPAGFALLLLQAVSELIKRIAFLRGALPEPFSVESEKSDAERPAELAAVAEAPQTQTHKPARDE